MYKLAKWIYAIGANHERTRFKADLLLYFNEQPIRYADNEKGIKESDEHYKKRVDGWFYGRKMLDEFFDEMEYYRNKGK
jgi:hypothetical protein